MPPTHQGKRQGKQIHECYVCGKPAEGTGVVEGASVDLCDNCADYARDFRYYQLPELQRTTQVQQQVPAFARKTQSQFELVADYSKRLREAREKKGWTREELGKQTLISRQEITSFEEARVKPTVEQARKLEFKLGVKLLEMQSFESERAPITKTDLEQMVRENVSRHGDRNSRLTLADVVEVKKKK